MGERYANTCIRVGLSQFPTFAAAAGNPNIGAELLKGKKLGGKTYKVHLDGYDQTDMLTKGGESARNELWYFTQTQLAAIRIGDVKYGLLSQPGGWLGVVQKNTFPTMDNLRLDPFERMGFGPGESFMSFQNYYAQEIWRMVFMQEEVAKLAMTAVDYPPMQAGASFNLDAAKKQIAEARAAHAK